MKTLLTPILLFVFASPPHSQTLPPADSARFEFRLDGLRRPLQGTTNCGHTSPTAISLGIYGLAVRNRLSRIVEYDNMPFRFRRAERDTIFTGMRGTYEMNVSLMLRGLEINATKTVGIFP